MPMTPGGHYSNLIAFRFHKWGIDSGIDYCQLFAACSFSVVDMINLGNYCVEFSYPNFGPS